SLLVRMVPRAPTLRPWPPRCIVLERCHRLERATARVPLRALKANHPRLNTSATLAHCGTYVRRQHCNDDDSLMAACGPDTTGANTGNSPACTVLPPARRYSRPARRSAW